MKLSEVLIGWYRGVKRDLPWRKTNDPYKIWLSEIILQQTQIKQGLPYYEAFVKRFPTVNQLAIATEEEVLKLWQGLGYYSRARNLHATAKYVNYELKGIFPKSYNELLKLKGVGDYTASAIASICYNEATAVVDGNVYRVLSRYFGIDEPINTSKGFKVFKATAQEQLDISHPGDSNQAIMEFGAVQCTPKNPDCDKCPLINGCIAYKNSSIDILPVKLKSNKIAKKYFNFLVLISDDGKTVLEKREGKGIWQNLYQFPLIETDRSITPSGFHKELGRHKFLKNNVYDYSLFNSTDIVHKLSHQHLHTKFWIVQTKSLPKTAIKFDEIGEYAVPVLIENFIESFNF